MGKAVAHTPDPGNPATPSEADCTSLDVLSDAAREAAAKADPDNLPATRAMETRARSAHVVRRVRAGTGGLSQSKFAARFGFSAAAVRDWEQGRRMPEASTLSYRRVIECEPQAVERAGDDLIVAPRLRASSP